MTQPVPAVHYSALFPQVIIMIFMSVLVSHSLWQAVFVPFVHSLSRISTVTAELRVRLIQTEFNQ